MNDSSKVLGTPIGGVSEFDGDGDGFRTGPSGEDNIPAPLAELPEELTTEMLKKMQDQVDPRYLDKDKSPQKNDGDFMMSAEEIIKLPAENYHNQPLLDPDTADYLENQRKINRWGMNQRVRREGVFYPIILRKWGNGQITIFDGHHRLIAAYDNHPKFQVPYFLWEEEGNPEDEFTNFKPEKKDKTVSDVLLPTEKFADARRTGRPWLPLTQKGWTPELRQILDEQREYEKELAKILVPWFEKTKDEDRSTEEVGYMLHAIRLAFQGSDVTGDYEYLEGQFNRLPDNLRKSKEAKALLDFAKKNGVPSKSRRSAWSRWGDLYVDHVLESLKKENVPETNPFYKQMKYQKDTGVSNEFGKFMRKRMEGMENYGILLQAMNDIQKGREAVDAQSVVEKVLSNPDRRIGLNIKERVLLDVLDGGSLKNIFENNGRNAFIETWLIDRNDQQEKERIKRQMLHRQVADQMIFGIFGAGNKKENHPISAFFHPNGVQDVKEWGDAYGQISLVLKRDVESRATMTAGDSLAGKFMGASPLNDPQAVGVQGGWAGLVNDQLPEFENTYIHKYYEAQVFGGIDLSDIAYVAVPQGFKFENEGMIEQLQSRGLSVIEIPSSGFVAEPDEIKVKRDQVMNAPLLASYEGTKLFTTGEDTGYIVLENGKRMDIQSLSSVLKFGNWVFVENEEKSLSRRTMRRNNFVGRTHVLDRSIQAEAKALQLRTKQYVHDYYEIMSNTVEEKVDSPYTNPALRERIKDRVMAGSQGGRPGQWSARKAQLVAQRYRSAGGGYKKGRGKTKKQRSLSKWTKEKWRTSDGKPALRGGKMRRYLPDKVWGKLTPAQRAATNRKKIEGDKRGRQFVPNTETAERTAAKFRKKS